MWSESKIKCKRDSHAGGFIIVVYNTAHTNKCILQQSANLITSPHSAHGYDSLPKSSGHCDQVSFYGIAWYTRSIARAMRRAAQHATSIHRTHFNNTRCSLLSGSLTRQEEGIALKRAGYDEQYPPGMVQRTASRCTIQHVQKRLFIHIFTHLQ